MALYIIDVKEYYLWSEIQKINIIFTLLRRVKNSYITLTYSPVVLLSITD
ncbi:hypothetical protein ACN354_000570 [Listeria innocua]